MHLTTCALLAFAAIVLVNAIFDPSFDVLWDPVRVGVGVAITVAIMYVVRKVESGQAARREGWRAHNQGVRIIGC
jgi:hypothetical protein